MKRHLAGRPVSVQRFPDGVGASGFFQKNVPDYYPDWITRHPLPAEDGTVTYLVVDSEATLAFLAVQACITLHVAPSRVDRPQHPDRMIFDLDPAGEDDVGGVRHGALVVREALREHGFEPHVMTSGSRGLYVVCGLDRSRDYDAVRASAKDLAQSAALRDPERLTTEVRKDRRRGRIFIDYLRNPYGQTAVAPYSVRPRPDGPIAAPLDWSEVEDTDWHPRRTTLATIFRRLGQKPDSWPESALQCFLRR